MRLLIIIFILLQGVIAIAEEGKPTLTPTRISETSQSASTDADPDEDQSLRYTRIDSMFTLYQPDLGVDVHGVRMVI